MAKKKPDAEPVKKAKPRRLTHKEKKQRYKQQLALEKKLVEEGKIPRRARYAPRGFFWRMFALCLSFFLGIFVCIGGLVGGGVLLGTTTPSRTLLDMLGLDSEKYLKEAYLNMSLLDVYSSVINDLNTLADPDDLTLDTFSKYTPIVDEYIDGLDQNLKALGVTLDWEEFRTQKFPSIVSYAKEKVLPTVQIGPILGLDKEVTLEKINANAPMYTLAYGSILKDYTVSDGGIAMADGKSPTSITDLVPTLFGENAEGNGVMDFLGDLELGSLLGLDIRLPDETEQDVGMLYALCYGTEGDDFEFGSDGILRMKGEAEPVKVKTLTSDINGHLNTLSLGAVLGLTSAEQLQNRASNALMYTLCYGSEGVDYEVRDNKLIHIEGGMTPTTIGDLIESSNAVVNKLALGDMLGLTGADQLLNRKNNALMYTLCYGSEGVDYEVRDNKLVHIEGGMDPVTVGDLVEGSNAVVNRLPLGDMLGLNTAENLENRKDNALMYTLCYGSEGVDYRVEGGKIVRLEGGKDPTTVGDLTNSSNAVVNGLPLGDMLGLTGADQLENRANNALMYTLCYGTEGVDYNVEDGKIVHIDGGKDPTTVGTLTENSNGVVNGLPLGEMLGLNTAEKVRDRENNAVMYALCYGAEGVDYDVVDDRIVMKAGVAAKTVGDLTESSSELIDSMEVETLLGVKPDSDAVIRYIAYGAELPKEDGEYVKDEDGNYLVEADPDHEGKRRYAGGGRYVIETDESGKQYVRMLSDPNDGTVYAKRTIGSLTAKDANLLEGITIGSIVEIDGTSSGIMQALKDWTIEDLKSQEKIETLKIGDLMEIDGSSSALMQAMEGWTLADLKDQSRIESLQIGQIVALGDSPSGIMQAISEWTIGDLNKQEKIDSLKIGDLMEIDDTSSGIMQAMQTWTLAELKDQEKIEGLKIGDLMEIDGSSSGIMQAMQTWTLAELKDQEKIEGLKLGDLMQIDGSSSAIMQAMQTWTLADLKDQKKIESLKIGQIVALGESPSGIMKAISEWTIGDLNKQSRIERLKIGQIIDLGDAPSGIMKAMQNWRISDLNDQKKIDSLTLSDIIEINERSPQMLRALAGMSLGEIATSIDTLTLEDVLGADAFEDNPILSAIRFTQIKNLGTAIGGLTLDDVFGDDVFSYAKKDGFDKNVRVSEENKLTGVIETRYYKDGTPVTPGWYKRSGEGWEKVEDRDVKNNSYVEVKTYVTRTTSYLVVEYDKPSASWQPYAGSPEQVKHDSFSDYYMNGDTRVDLEPVYTYQKDGAPVLDKHIYTESSDGGEKYYYKEQIEVTLRYADGGTTYGANEITERYFQGDTEAVRYRAGVWYLLFREEEEMGKRIPIKDIAKEVSGAAGKINELTLKEMYVHELINTDPSTDITNLKKMGFTTHDNLDEMTITEIIEFVKKIVAGSGSMGGFGGLGG